MEAWGKNTAVSTRGYRALPLKPGKFLSGNVSTLLLFLVVAVELGVGVFLLRDLRASNAETQSMYAGSVLGLRNIGEMQYQAQETRRSTLYALTTNDSNLQIEYADWSRAADKRFTEGIADYLRQVQEPRAKELGNRLSNDWSKYLKVRDEVLGLILEGSTQEAVQLDLAGGVPSFDHVHQDLDQIKRLYDEQASHQLAHVAASSRRSIVRLIIVLMFTVFFASFGIWAIQRSKVQSTLELARLQMEFVASVSHELRTPLAVICSAADNLADGVVGGREQIVRYCSMIRKQGLQLTELVNQILLFASARESHERVVLRPLQVPQVVSDVLESTSSLVQEAGFVVDRQIQPGLPPAMANASALSHCLQNLIANAVKYGGEARWIGISAREGKAEDHSPEVRISIEDHGPGIAAEEMPRIFDAFYRSPSVGHAQIHGTGLGLAVAKGLAEAMGARISVTSQPGKGSTFTVHLPAAMETDARIEVLTAGSNLVTKK